MAVAVGDLVEVLAGPFGGVVDSTDPHQGTPHRLFDALNGYVPDPVLGSAFLARHGFQGQTTQLGAGDLRRGQCVFLHRRLNGAVDRFTFGGGKMYRWDGATNFEDITPAGISIHTSNPIFCATYNDEVIVSDENNKPWIYTPSTAAAEVIEYNDAGDEWATKGGPVVWGGFVFFIVRGAGQATLVCENDDVIDTESDDTLITELTSGLLNTITWGNALDPRTGYDQADFDHNIQLTQTSTEVLGALAAHEGALLYFRTEGIGYLTGTVNDDFRTQNTKDGISTTRGTNSPAAVVTVDRRTYFLDLDGRLFRCQAGAGEPEELWFPIRRQVDTNFGTSENRANVLRYARGAYHPTYDLVLFTIWDASTIYAFHARSGKYMGQWEVLGGVHITAMGAMMDGFNRATFCLLGTRGTSDTAADHGVFWKQKFPSDSSPWLDQADRAVESHTAFTRAIETHWMAHKAVQTFRVLKVHARLVGDSSAHAVRMQYMVPKAGLSTAITAQSSVVTGEMSSSDSISTARWSLGRKAQGSAVRIRVSATHSDDHQWGVHDVLAQMQVTQVRPRAA